MSGPRGVSATGIGTAIAGHASNGNRENYGNRGKQDRWKLRPKPQRLKHPPKWQPNPPKLLRPQLCLVPTGALSAGTVATVGIAEAGDAVGSAAVDAVDA